MLGLYSPYNLEGDRKGSLADMKVRDSGRIKVRNPLRAEDKRTSFVDIENPDANGWVCHIDERTGKKYYYNKKTKTSTWEIPVDPETHDFLDPSMIFSMERTVLSAYNQAFQIMLVGGGLMAVGAQNDDTPAHLGAAIFVAGIVYGVVSYGLHLHRLRTLRKGQKISMLSSAAWIGFLMLFATVGMSIELYYAIIYPYLERAQEVSFAAGGFNTENAAPTNSTLSP